MTHITSLMLCWVMIGSLSGPALAEPDLSHCRQIRDKSLRLNCYDRRNIESGALSKVMLDALECKSEPTSAKIINELIALRIVHPKRLRVADSQNYFALEAPQKIGSLTAIAIVGFDETGDPIWQRSPGTSPGRLIGFVTRDSLYEIDEWRKRFNPNLEIDDSMSGLRGTKDIICRKF